MPLPRTALARRKLLRMLGLVAVGAAAGTAASAGSPRLVGPAMAAESTLPRPRDWQALLSEAAAGGHPVVVLFSTPGCAYCRFVRHDHLRHLAAASPGGSGVHVVELSLADRRPFDRGATSSPVGDAASLLADTGSPGSVEAATPATRSRDAIPASPAALAASLGIRFAPTVAFFGPDGELAERLVGYQSADFYGAYLEQRIATASTALREARSKALADS